MSVILSMARAWHRVFTVIKTALGLFPVKGKKLFIIYLYRCGQRRC